jgi:copper(I)-binding protein
MPASSRLGRVIRPAALVASLVLIVGACGAGGASVKASEAWVRYTGPDVAAGGFMVLTNSGDQDDALVSASSPAFATIEMHETVVMEASPSASMGAESASPMGGGMVGMQPVSSITVPAGGTTELKPGGYHLMLFDPTGEVTVGQTVDITLTFDKAGDVTVKAEVKAP